ncbi:hypothetical protein CKM354_001121500 [Cercospora kikuchii]|uniref:S-adenosyl-L-methionine-dependent methyltransferase n=1 Tax=Cercospora kikuchii TaxID=84275 RepID=A0A9P3CV55_9PEZI|nr:uncharacterized protein CKM354_001121500 [Cercospora kikuchii]GIZ48142.1 hypothetical protein CKM354_001121500 [Cercospora kikuchii]
MDKDNKNDSYPLSRDFLASSRLHLQHQAWIASLGYHLHPSIPISDNTIIADIGCGNGIWSVELAKQLPTGAKIESSDISLAQCPPRGWWPSNVTFSELDIFAPLTEQLVGRFDVVNIRHFICVVQSGDPTKLITALVKLLKPGGYLQWQEFDLSSSRLVVVDAEDSPETIAPRMNALVKAVSAFGAQTKWIKELHTFLDGPEIELIEYDRKWTAKEAIMLKQDSGYLGSRELRINNSSSEHAAQFEQLADAAYEECLQLNRRSLVDSEMVTWVARKR